MEDLAAFGGIKKDTKVQIKRSNGNQHEAIVTSIIPETQIVNVEWFENQDIKGMLILFLNF